MIKTLIYMALIFSKSDVSALWKYPPDTTHPSVPLKCVQPQKGFIRSHSFSGESAEGKGGPESVFTMPDSDALTLPIKNVNTSCKHRLEDVPIGRQSQRSANDYSGVIWM